MPYSQLLEGISFCKFFKQPAVTAMHNRLLVGNIQMGSASFLDEFDQGVYSVQHDSLSVVRCHCKMAGSMHLKCFPATELPVSGNP